MRGHCVTDTGHLHLLAGPCVMEQPSLSPPRQSFLSFCVVGDTLLYIMHKSSYESFKQSFTVNVSDTEKKNSQAQ